MTLAPPASPDEGRAAFVRAHTTVTTAALVPEVRLYLATEVTPLWQATEAEMRATGLEPPYWAFAWPGSQALARHLLDHPEIVRGRTVLDLAAGGGLAGLAAARAGAASVLCAEVDPLAATAIGLNAALNNLTHGVSVTLDDLLPTPGSATAQNGAPDGGQDGGQGDWAVILAGDVCYQKDMADRVTRFLVAHAAAGAHVLLADPGRAYVPRGRMTIAARYSVPTSLELEDRETRETILYRLAAPSRPHANSTPMDRVVAARCPAR